MPEKKSGFSGRKSTVSGRTHVDQVPTSLPEFLGFVGGTRRSLVVGPSCGPKSQSSGVSVVLL